MPSLNTSVKPNCILCLPKCVLSLFVFVFFFKFYYSVRYSYFMLWLVGSKWNWFFARIVHQSNIGVLKLYNSGAAVATIKTEPLVTVVLLKSMFCCSPPGSFCWLQMCWGQTAMRTSTYRLIVCLTPLLSPSWSRTSTRLSRYYRTQSH